MTGESPKAILREWFELYAPRMDSAAIERQWWNVLDPEDDGCYGPYTPGIQWNVEYRRGSGPPGGSVGYASRQWLSKADMMRAIVRLPGSNPNYPLIHALAPLVGIRPGPMPKLWRLTSDGAGWLSEEAMRTLALPIAELAHWIGRPDPDCRHCRPEVITHLCRDGIPGRNVQRRPVDVACDCRKLKVAWAPVGGWTTETTEPGGRHG